VIPLVLSMIAARRTQALTVFLLSAVAIAAAVAGPVALRQVDEAIVRYEVAGATNTEKSLSVTAFVNPSARETAAQFDNVAALLDRPGFDQIRSGELEAFGPVPAGRNPTGAPTSRLVFRDRVCDHIVVLSGRCFAGPLEVVIGEDVARVDGMRAGDAILAQAARFEVGRGLVPDGAPALLTVVGIYRARDANEPYWAGQRYFPVTANGTRREAVFFSVQTFDLIDHSIGQSSVDTLAPPQALTPERIANLPAELDQVIGPLEEGQQLAVDTDLPALAARIQRSRDLARSLVPVAFIPLVALCFFVIFLAVGYGVYGRRQELGLVTLRGVSRPRRWWLATGETALVIIAAAPVGYFLGYAVVDLVARLRLGGDGVTITAGTLPYAGLALAGALLVGVAGQRRAIAEPVIDLLRGVPRAVSRWQSLLVEILAVVLAVVATIQLRSADLGGITLLVPGLVVVAVALVGAQAFRPAAGLVASLALRQGKLGTGLAAVQLARRPGAQRLLVLIAVASAMLTFVAAALDVAGRAREDRALIATGATGVVTVDQTDARRLLHVTRTVDPEGSWAMAVMPVEQKLPGAPKLLALDSSRLGAVAVWRPEFGPTAASVAKALAPPPAQPFLFQGKQLSVDVENVRELTAPKIDLNLSFAPLVGGDVVSVKIKELAPGRAVRTIGVTGCENGCRLTALSVALLRTDRLRLSVFRISQLDPPRDIVPAADLIRRNRWRVAGVAEAGPVAGALQIAAAPTPFESGDITVATVDAALPVPVVTTVDLADNGSITSVDGEVVDAKVGASPRMLPRLGTAGALADLEYLERTALGPPRRAPGEVWLGPNAPADAAERLRRAGLAVSQVTGIEHSRDALGHQGPALALQFHLAAALFGIALALGGLGLVATVDRRRRAEDLRVLRQQGLPEQAVARASLWSYLSTVVSAAGLGLVAAAVAWLAAGDRLPIFTDTSVELRPPRWPQLWVVVLPWAAATAVMVIGSVLTAWALRRAVARNGRGL
jgi:putative ABC transport system permease protein